MRPVTTNDRPNRARGKPLAAVAIVIAAIVVFAILAYIYATPYLVLDRLKQAADARDAETVDRYVDYPALRASLKQQLSQLLSRRVESQKREHPLAAFGALVGMALIGPLVDNYATPEGVAALLNGMPPRGEPSEALSPPAPPTAPSAGKSAAAPAAPPSSQATPAPAENAPAAPKRVGAHYRGIDEFVVTYRHDAASAPYSVILRRDGWFSWRLSAVDLNQQ
ncbi:DUF2939 domain-containing protein [Trinickia sp. EG282A]|uniref:DUF2939 domain-containing protein n=1 Tax=Trinickia sp. EG282A TaxID=3237013 RepID=UPI0034D213F3